jgi:hypothetical protein
VSMTVSYRSDMALVVVVADTDGCGKFQNGKRISAPWNVNWMYRDGCSFEYQPYT